MHTARSYSFYATMVAFVLLGVSCVLFSLQVGQARAEEESLENATATYPGPRPGLQKPLPPKAPYFLNTMLPGKDTRSGSTTVQKKEPLERKGLERGDIKPRPMFRPGTASTTTPRMEHASTALKARFEEERHKMEERMMNQKNELKSRFAKKGQEQFEKVLKRLTAALLRLGNITERIESRIAKLEEMGRDMSGAKSLLATAKSKIADADAKIKAIPTPIFPDTNDASTTPQMINDALKGARESVMGAEQALRDAKRALEAVLKEMRAKGGAQADDE